MNITVSYSDTTNKYTFTTAVNATYSLTILATSTMNPVLGFEPGLVSNSISNAIGSILSSTIKITAGITLSSANNMINIDFPGFTTKTWMIAAGGPYSAVAMQNSIQTNF